MTAVVTAVDALSERPIALVAVDVPLPHLDRPFEYTVPEELTGSAVPGARVKVRFAGRDVGGYVLERRAAPEHQGRLAPLRRVVSPEPVLTPRLIALCRRVADAHAGTFADVVRLAIPPRHAAAEKALDAIDGRAAQVSAQEGADPRGGGAWEGYPAGASLLRRLAAGESPSAAWSALPGQPEERDWPAALAEAAAATLASGRGVLLLVPDARDLARLDAALARQLGAGAHVLLSAAQGPQARYTAWLKILRGHVKCVAGTRAAAFAPVADLGLVAWWDDGDDAYEELRAPYPHVRDVLAVHAELTGAARLVGGFARSTDTQLAIDEGVLREVVPDMARRRAAAPRVKVAGEGSDEEREGAAARARLPGVAWRLAREALAEGPVLVQVPRRGYIPGLSCRTCRTPARCQSCAGPLGLDASGKLPSCRWCGAAVPSYVCAVCGDQRLRTRVVGAWRTAEEIGRAFPGVRVEMSGGDHVRDHVDGRPLVLVATPGAEPVADGGYAAVLLLDAWASLERPTLDVMEEALRRWLAAAALARPGAWLVLAGAPQGVTVPAIEALVRWAPEWFAARELAERTELGLPPAGWVASVRGPRRAVAALLEGTSLPDGVQRYGPVPLPGEDSQQELILRADRVLGTPAAAALAAGKAIRSARKDIEPVQTMVGRLPSAP